MTDGRMRPTMAWTALGLAAALGCQETLTAPGACPEFCPDVSLDLVDSVLANTIVRDSTFRGYVLPHRGRAMQLVTQGTSLESRGVIRFFQFPEELGGDVGEGQPLLATDSFRLELTLKRRGPGASGLELAIYRLPVTVDSSTSFADLDPYFADSTLLVTITVPDTLTAGAVMGDWLAAAFPTFEADGRQAALGVALRAPAETFVSLGTAEGGETATLTRFVTVDSSGMGVVRQDLKPTMFDGFVTTGLPEPAPGALAVGGVPSARSLLHFDLPASVMDFADVVRATLILVPAEPIPGVPGDSILVRVDQLAADFGPKSPIVPPRADTLPPGLIRLAVGSADSVRVDVTHVVTSWQAAPDAPRAVMVRALSEGAGIAEFRFLSSTAAAPPSLHVTYAPREEPRP